MTASSHGPGELPALELLRLGEKLAGEDRDLQARLAFERARAAFLAQGDRVRALYALARQGTAELALRDLLGAQSHLEHAYEEVVRALGSDDESRAKQAGDGVDPGPEWLLADDADLGAREATFLQYVEAAVLSDLGLLASIDGRGADAARLLERAIALFEALGCEREEGDAHRFLAIARVKSDEPGLAGLEFQRAEACYTRAGDALRRALARGQSSKMYFDQGLYAEAVGALDEALGELERRGLPGYWLRYHRAMNLERLGRGDEAFADLERAFEDLLSTSRHVTAPGVRARFLEGKETIPATLIARAWTRGQDDAVHRAVQRTKTSGWLELLGGRDLIARAIDHEGPSSRAYLDARGRLRDLDARLALKDDPEVARARVALLAELERLEASLDTRDAAVVGPRPLALDEVQAALAPGTLVLDYVFHRDGLGVVMITRTQRTLVSLDHVGRGRDAAPRFVDECVERVDSVTRRAAAELEAGDLEQALHLYERLGVFEQLHDAFLGAPEVQAAVEEADEVVVVPHRQLFRIPWHLLRKDGRYLIEERPVSILPTLAALRSSAPGALELDRTSRVLFLVTGNDEPRMRLTLAEIGSALPRFRNVCLVTGGEATRRRLEADVGNYDLLHFAGHASFDEAFPTLSHLALGAGRADPAWDRLTVRDILQLRLRPSLVVLSACQTARARASSGEELIGLAHAFLIAGARAVIGTAWPFEPRTSQALLPALYDGLLAGLAPAQALRAAQLALRRSDGVLRCPYHWGAFTATYAAGWRGGSRQGPDA